MNFNRQYHFVKVRSEDVILHRLLKDMGCSPYGANETCRIIKKFSDESRLFGIEGCETYKTTDRWWKKVKFCLYGEVNHPYTSLE